MDRETLAALIETHVADCCCQCPRVEACQCGQAGVDGYVGGADEWALHLADTIIAALATTNGES